ncbi:MAG: diaminopimelate epimerase [Candidatus Omnitrophica bacterium]|nr:diaminopimelate epimerase [Candidatus Omnitrophota bacterium]
MEFSKIVGSGNDFVIIDNREGKIKNKRDLAIKLCNRKFGIGADGLLFLENSNKADFKMRIFNPDGSEAEMCGNGLRCMLRFIYENSLTNKRKLKIETMAGILDGEIKGKNIKIKMKLIGKLELNIKIPIDNEIIIGNYVNTGVPHTIIFVEDIEKVNISELGPKIRYNKIFGEKGTNVDWVEIVKNGLIKIRTYERGVEEETLSCGTGSVASAIITFLIKGMNSPINVITRSNEILKVYFDKNLKNIYLEGKTFYAFVGKWIES